MKIIADENIPYVAEAFASFGSVQLVPGRQINSKMVQKATILLVRSVTPVNQELLQHSSVQFVASATIGMDHIDQDYLKSQKIGFSNAAGSNANSAAEYVIAAIIWYAAMFRLSLTGKVLGVVGVGNIGSKVVKFAEALGMTVLQNDPPLARQTGESRFVALDELMDADFITLHVPLIKSGVDKTFHFFDKQRHYQMKPGSILINTSRGPVVETVVAKQVLFEHHLRAMFLDVWENEPQINIGLLNYVSIGTPHIAGYSLDGKINGTGQIYRAAANFFHQPVEWNPAQALPLPEAAVLETNAIGKTDEQVLHEIIQQVYDIEADDSKLREITKVLPAKRVAHFDRLRKNYPCRREFHNYQIHLTGAEKALVRKFTALGFQVRYNSR